MSGINGIENNLPSEVLEKFQRILYNEAEETKREALATVKLAIEIYKSGEKELALIVLKESTRIARSYLELLEKLDASKDDAISLITGIEEIEELIRDNEKVNYIKEIYEELK